MKNETRYFEGVKNDQAQQSTFEQQFAAVQEVIYRHNRVEYLDLKPENWQQESPILLVGDWAMTRRSLHDTARVLYDNQRRTVMVDFKELGGGFAGKRDFYFEIADKGNFFPQILTELETARVDVLAHSEGALSATYAALYYSEFFDKLVLAMPAGMIGKDSMLRFMMRFMPQAVRVLTKDVYDNPSVGLSINRDIANHMLQNPGRAYREAQAMVNIPIDGLLADLKIKGIKVGVLQAHFDTVFPDYSIAANVKLEGSEANVDAYASLITKSAGHDYLMIQPWQAARAALDMLDNL